MFTKAENLVKIGQVCSEIISWIVLYRFLHFFFTRVLKRANRTPITLDETSPN